MKTRKELEELLMALNEAYRRGEPMVSDIEYDRLLEEYLKRYSDAEGYRFVESLSGVVQVDIGRKEKLPTMMTSLDKCKSVADIQAWLQTQLNGVKCQLVITPKFDGISLLEKTVEAECWTKGVVADMEGQRSDKHFQLVDKIDIGQTQYDYTIGEAIMKRSLFDQKYSKKVGGKYSHPRNMVAGLFNANEPGEALKDVFFMRYGYPRNSGGTTDKREQVLEFNTPYILCSSEAVTEEYLDKVFHTWKESLDYDIDGLVLDIGPAVLRSLCDPTAAGNVGYAVAYKSPKWAGNVTTKFLKLDRGVSKQGKIKPVAIIEPVDVDGVTIERVTVNNMRMVSDLSLSPGCEVTIKRSGDVIPKITKVHGIKVPQRDEVQNDKDFQEAWKKMKDTLDPLWSLDALPEYWNECLIHCPSCGNELQWGENSVEMICHNPQCFDRLVAKSVYFFETLGVENFGEPSIRQIIQTLELKKNIPFEIVILPYDTLLTLPGWAETSIKSLQSQFNKIRKEGVPLAKLMTALDLFEGKLAEKTCQVILETLSSEDLGNLLDLDIPEMTREDRTKVLVEYEKAYCKLNAVKGVSTITADAFVKGWREWVDLSLISPIGFSYIRQPNVYTKSNILEGKQFCFTGVRDKELEGIIIENGGKVVDGVSKNTTHLIVADLNSTSSKMKRAQELNIQIIQHPQFKGVLEEMIS